MRKTKKFASGGTSRADAMRDRRMADIEKDYRRALARGMSERQAQAKRDQRIADARDDYAKRTGADRTETRAAERAAEQKLTATRRGADTGTKPVSVVSEGSKSLAAKADMPEVKTPDFTPKKAAPAPAKKRAVPARGASRPATTSTRTPAYSPRALRELEAEVNRPGAGARARAEAAAAKNPPKDKNNPPKQQAPVTSAQRQQAQLEELGRGLSAPFRALSSFGSRIRARGEASDPTLKKAKGGKVKKYAKGGKIDGIAIRGKTKAGRKK